MVGVVEPRLSYTLRIPLFSATNTRPSLANLIAVGLVSPVKTAVSWNPGGRVTPRASPATRAASDVASRSTLDTWRTIFTACREGQQGLRHSLAGEKGA